MKSHLKSRFNALDGDIRLIEGDSLDAEPFVIDQRERRRSTPDFVVLPGTTEDVAEVVRLCNQYSIGIVPQGGNSGLVGGATACNGEIILSTRRLNRIRQIDAANNTLVAEAGCVLADVQRAATEQQRFFPLSLGSEGTCTIGGNISTNAGGINVLRYGNTRQAVLGLEVVLADGCIWSGLNSLRKNNTGYDLNQLFIGAEGTLGIVTAAELQLWPKPVKSYSVFCGFKRLENCIDLLNLARRLSGDQLSSFELMPDIAVELACKHFTDCRRPFPERFSWYVLCQFASSSDLIPLNTIAERFLELASEQNLLQQAVMASSISAEKALWQIRECLVLAQRKEGESAKHDVAVPVHKIPQLVHRVTAELARDFPGVQPYPFGHVGDGNLHFNLMQPGNMEKEAFRENFEAMHRLVYDIVIDLGGTFSAEHGIGVFKKTWFNELKDPTSRHLMRSLRQTLDPERRLQKGKLFD